MDMWISMTKHDENGFGSVGPDGQKNCAWRVFLSCPCETKWNGEKCFFLPGERTTTQQSRLCHFFYKKKKKLLLECRMKKDCESWMSVQKHAFLNHNTLNYRSLKCYSHLFGAEKSFRMTNSCMHSPQKGEGNFSFHAECLSIYVILYSNAKQRDCGRN